MPAKMKIVKEDKKVVKKKTIAAKPNVKTVRKQVSAKKAIAPKKTVQKKVVVAKTTSPKKVVSTKKSVPSKPVVNKKEKIATTKKATTKEAVSKLKGTAKKTAPVKKVKTKKSENTKEPKVINKTTASKTVVKKIVEPSKSDVKVHKNVDAKKSLVKNKKIEDELKENVVKIHPKSKVRFSDEDLKMFNDRIVEMRKEAIEELRMLRERLDDLTNYDFAEESMIYSMHMAEQGSEAFEKEKTYAQIQRINEYIKKLDEALGRIKDKTFGICRVCGCLIAKERLLAVPITTLSASYKIQKKCPEDGIDRIEPLKNVE